MKGTNILVIAILIFIAGYVSGQRQNSVLLGLNGGLSLPVGNFGSSSENNPENGFAKSGTHIMLDAAYFFNMNSGIRLAYTAHSFGAESQMFYDKHVYLTHNTTNLQSFGGNFKYSWNLNSLTIGPTYVYKISQRFKLDFNASFGILMSNEANADFSYLYFDSTGANRTMNREKQTSFAYEISVAGRAKVWNRFHGKLYAGFSGSSINWIRMTEQVSGGTPDEPSKEEIKGGINFISVGIGITYSFLVKKLDQPRFVIKEPKF